MTKGIYNYLGIHQLFKLHGINRHGFEPCRRALAVLFMVTISVLTSLAQTPLNETEVYNRLMERQYMAGYTEGTPWTNDIPYSFDDPYLNHVEFDGYPSGCYGGAGCFGFMMDMMEYASNYEYPIRLIYGTYDNLPEIRVGDGIRLNNDTHSVVVLEVHPDGHTVTVAEGNFNSSVHWGRIIDLADPNNGFYYLATFWPEQEPAEPVTITIGESGYATFYYPNSAYAIPDGVEAKAVESISGKTINLMPLAGIIPQGYAVILEGEPGEYTFEPTSEEGIFVENMLRGTEEKSMIALEDQMCKYYMLSTKNGKVGFYYGANDGGVFMNEAHKAYLPVPVSQSNGANAFFFDAATSIDNMLSTDEHADRAIYNLSGQRVSDSYKGVVIVYGKKVLRK
ncbi:MAG: hypothetical protein IKH86_11725 [Prevotella sp.]|nr:hypothetical protein [Prevotella sp.]